jgi:hypothetical protein
LTENPRNLVEVALQRKFPASAAALSRNGSAWARAPIEPAILLALLLIEFPFLIYLFGLASLWVGGALSGIVWPIALTATLATLLALRFSKRSAPTSSDIVGISFVILVAAFTALAGAFYDVSFDGQTYHQEAVIQLSQGWNPFLGEISDLYLVKQRALEAAINFYPKAPWVIASVHQLFFENIEAGKVTFWLYAASAFLCTYSLNRQNFGFARVVSIILALAVITNPIAISQSLSFYVDGHVYFLLIVTLTCLMNAASAKQPKPATCGSFTMGGSLLVNTKVPAVAFAGFFILCYAGYALLIYFRQGDFRIIRSAVLFSAGGLFALVAMGADPYVTNTVKYGNPFHAVLGSDRIIETSPQRPRDFAEITSLEMLFRSVFSTSANPPWDGTTDSELKIPFSVQWPEEARAFTAADLRTGGFGPIFSGILLLSLISATAMALFTREWLPWSVSLFLALLLVFSSALHPEAWWLRYVPQLYLVPLVLCGYILLYAPRTRAGVLFRCISWAVPVFLIFNATMGASYYFPHIHDQNREIDAQLDKLQAMYAEKAQIREVYFGAFRSNRIRLKDMGIPYFELGEDKNRRCRDIIGMPSSTTYACLDRLVELPTATPLCQTPDLASKWPVLLKEKREKLLSTGQCRRYSRPISAGIVYRGALVSRLNLLNTFGEDGRMWVSNNWLGTDNLSH